MPRVAPNGKYSKNLWNATEEQHFKLQQTEIEWNDFLYFSKSW